MIKEKQHTVWVEKYRPQTLEDFICDEVNLKKLQEYINNQDIPHLMFVGKPGSGKTTLTKLLAKNINCDYLLLNATDERSMDVMRDKVKTFASSATFKPLKIVILDESTHLLQASQVILLNMIETFSLNTRFILTGNFVERLIEPLRSRLQEFDLKAPSKKVVAHYVDNILEKENINYETEDLVKIINHFYPDLRKIINTCQKNIINNKLTLDKSLSNSDNGYEEILKEFQKPKPDFKNIRQLVINLELSEYDDLYRFLFDNLEKYSKGNDGEIILILSEMNYQSGFKVDKELNMVAALYKIYEVIIKKRII